MNKFIIGVVGVILVVAMLILTALYIAESKKSDILRTEHLKTADESQQEIKKIKGEFEKEKSKNLEDKQRLLDQVTQLSQEKDKIVKEGEGLRKRFSQEKEISFVANEDMDKLRTEVIKARKENKEGIEELEKVFKRKQQSYESRVLSLEAQLEKAKKKINSEAERYHYNLGVVYTQNKEFDSAIAEFKTALGYGPKNAQAHYNLGIIYDDYFKDKENARYHYRSFLELDPNSEDAESIREWLANLDR